MRRGPLPHHRRPAWRPRDPGCQTRSPHPPAERRSHVRCQPNSPAQRTLVRCAQQLTPLCLSGSAMLREWAPFSVARERLHWSAQGRTRSLAERCPTRRAGERGRCSQCQQWRPQHHSCRQRSGKTGCLIGGARPGLCAPRCRGAHPRSAWQRPGPEALASGTPRVEHTRLLRAT